MSLFSIFMLMFTCVNFFKNKSNKTRLLTQTAFTLFIYLFVNRGYFIQSEILNVDYWQAALLLEFLLCIPITFHKTKYSKYFFCYFFSLMLSVILLIIIPCSSETVVGAAGDYAEVLGGFNSFITPHFTKITIFILALAIIQGLVFENFLVKLDCNDISILIQKLKKYIFFMAVVLLIEIVTKDILQSNIYNEILNIVFGQGTSTYTTLVSRGTGYMLTGFNREGSHLVYSLAFGIIVLFTDIKVNHLKKRRASLLAICVLVIVILFSGAFSMIMSMLFLTLLLLVYYVYKNPSKKKRIIRWLSIILLIVFMSFIVIPIIYNNLENNNYISQRLLNFVNLFSHIFDTNINYYRTLATIDSNTTRLYSVIDSLKNIVYRPLFGMGIATTYCHGATALTLCEIGIIGFITYINFYFTPFVHRVKNKNYMVTVVLIWIVINLLFSITPRMIVGLDGVLLMFCSYAIAEHSKLKKIK